MEKNIKFSNKIIFFILIIIFFVSLILRLIHITAPTGLWFDELFCLISVKKSFPFGIIENLILHDDQMPLYYLILHIWIKIFGDSDTNLRLFSVISGSLIIPIIYLAGKELDSKKTGIIAAAFIAINSFLIYYSQEVRLYSFLSLLSAFTLLLIIKAIKNPNMKIFIFLMFSNLAIIFTYTIGIVFVGLEISVLGIYFFYNNKKLLPKFLLSQIIIPGLLFLIYIPSLIIQIRTFHDFCPKLLFHPSNFILYIQNWFSPYILGFCSNFDNYFNILKQLFSAKYILLNIPVIIGIYGIITGVLNKKVFKIIFAISILFFLFQFISALTSNMYPLTRYTIILIPPILLLAAGGLVSIKNKFISDFLITLYIVINLAFIITDKQSILKKYRDNGLNIPLNALQQENIPLSSDNIIFNSLSGTFFKRYCLPQYGQVINFSFFDTPILDEYLLRKFEEKNYLAFKDYFINKKVFPSSNVFFNENIYKKLPKNNYFILMRNIDTSPLNEEKIKLIAENYEFYTELEKKSLLFNLVNNKFINDIEKIASEKYKLNYIIKQGFWIIYVYQNN